MKVLKLSISLFLSGDRDLFIFGAKESKYLLNSSAIIQCSIMRSLLIISEDLMDSLFSPYSWFIAALVCKMPLIARRTRQAKPDVRR